MEHLASKERFSSQKLTEDKRRVNIRVTFITRWPQTCKQMPMFLISWIGNCLLTYSIFHKTPKRDNMSTLSNFFVVVGQKHQLMQVYVALLWNMHVLHNVIVNSK